MATIQCTVQRSSWYSVYIEYDYEQSTANNTSNVTASLKLRQETDSYDFDTVKTVTCGFYMDGAYYSNTARVNIDNKGNTGYTITLCSGSKTISHNSAGEGSVTFSVDFSMDSGGWGPGTIKLASTKKTLTTIPRASSIDKVQQGSSSTIYTGTAFNVYWTPKASTFKYRVKVTLGGSSYWYPSSTTYKSPGTTSQTSISVDALAHKLIPNDSKGTATIVLYSYSGDSQIGSSSKSVTIYVPSAVKPSVSNLTIAGNNLLGGNYVQGKSTATLTATASGDGGSTIKSYVFTGTGISTNTVSNNSVTTSKIITKGSVSYSVYVVDSRGRQSTTVTKTITVQPYSNPQISNITRTRYDLATEAMSESGTAVLIRFKLTYSSVNKANNVQVYAYAKETTAADYATSSKQAVSFVSGDNEFVYSTIKLEPTKNYNIKLQVTDSYNTSSSSIESEITLKTAPRPINIAKYSNGVAIGGYSSVTKENAAGKFECKWPAQFDDLMVSTGGIRTEANGASNKYFETRRKNAQNEDGSSYADDNHKYTKMQMYIGDTGHPTIRNQYSTDDGETWTTRSYLRLQDDGVYVGGVLDSDTLNAENLNLTGSMYSLGDVITMGSVKFQASGSDANERQGSLHTDYNDDHANIVYLMTGVNTAGGEEAGVAIHEDSFYVPHAENSGIVNLGSDGRRWNQLYAQQGTIETSDKNQKTNISSMSDTQKALFEKLKPSTYQMKSGTSGRTHYGFIANDIEDALTDVGLTNTDFAGFCKDAQVDDDGQAILDENGNVMYNYSLRYSEFIALNTYMIQQLQAENEELKNTIQSLKEAVNRLQEQLQ